MEPPNSIDSVSASASEKFEIAWPARNPPNVPYANLRRGRRLSPPACCSVWQLKLLHPEKSNSKKVRDSPQAVGVRVSMLILDCCGLNSKTPLPRECPLEDATPVVPGTANWPSGIESKVPFWSALEPALLPGTVPPPCRKYNPVKSMKPPTRIDVSVPGIRN